MRPAIALLTEPVTIADAIRRCIHEGDDLILALHSPALLGEEGTVLGGSGNAFMNVHFTLDQLFRMIDRADAETSDR